MPPRERDKKKNEEKEQLEEDEQILAETLMDFADMGKTVDGKGFTYRSVVCTGKKVGPIKAIANYPHLLSLDLSQNIVKDVAPLKGLAFLVRLNLSDNQISSLKSWEPEEEEPPFPHLVSLDLSGNALPALMPLPMKALKTVRFARNEIVTCQDFTGHKTIEVLDLSDQRTGKITSLAGVSAMPALSKLDVSGNELEDITGLADLPVLKELNLARNKFKELNGPWQDLTELTSLNLAGCQMEVTKPLETLRNLPLLRTLQVADNPFCATLEDKTRVEVIICHWRLSSIDGEPVTEEEVEAAKQLNVEREEERLRQKAEEEAAAAAAEEGGG